MGREPAGHERRRGVLHHEPVRDRRPGLRIRLHVRRRRQPRGRLLGRPEHGRRHLGRGLPRRHLLGLRDEQGRVRRGPPALLRQHRRLPADRAVDVPAQPRVLEDRDGHGHGRPLRLPQLGRHALPVAAQLVPQVRHGILHRPGPGGLERQRQRGLHRRRRRVPVREHHRAAGPRPLRDGQGRPQQGRPERQRPARPQVDLLHEGRGPRLLAGHLRPRQLAPHLQCDPRRQDRDARLQGHAGLDLLEPAVDGLHRQGPRARQLAHLQGGRDRRGRELHRPQRRLARHHHRPVGQRRLRHERQGRRRDRVLPARRERRHRRPRPRRVRGPPGRQRRARRSGPHRRIHRHHLLRPGRVLRGHAPGGAGAGHLQRGVVGQDDLDLGRQGRRLRRQQHGHVGQLRPHGLPRQRRPDPLRRLHRRDPDAELGPRVQRREVAPDRRHHGRGGHEAVRRRQARRSARGHDPGPGLHGLLARRRRQPRRLAQPAQELLPGRRHRPGNDLPDRPHARRRRRPPGRVRTHLAHPAGALGRLRQGRVRGRPVVLLAPRRRRRLDDAQGRRAERRRRQRRTQRALRPGRRPHGSGRPGGGVLRQHRGEPAAGLEPDLLLARDVVPDDHHARRQADRLRRQRGSVRLLRQLRPPRLHAGRRTPAVRHVDGPRPTSRARPAPTTTASGTTWSRRRDPTA